MKKSFMTRALATGLSLAMAFSLTAATNVTTAAAAAKPAMKSSKMTVKVGQSKNYKATAATQKAYKITKVKLSAAGKTKADVTINSSKKSIKVTGKAATKGSNVVITFKNNKTKKLTKVTTKVVVKAVDEKLTMTAEATGVKKITVTFNKAVDTTTTKLVVKKGAATPTVASTTFAADAKSAEIVMGTKLTEGTYTVEATVGEEKLTADIATQNEKLTSFELVSPNLVASATITTVASISYKALNQYGEMMVADVPSVSCTFGTTDPKDNAKAEVKAPTADKSGKITVADINTALAIPGTTGTIVIVDKSTGVNLNTSITYQSKAVAAAAKVYGIYSYKTDKLIEGNLSTGAKVSDYAILMNVQDQYGADMTIDGIAESAEVSMNPAAVLTDLGLDKDKINDTTAANFKELTYDGANAILVPLAISDTTNRTGKIAKAGSLSLTIVSAQKGVIANPSFTVDEAKIIKTLSITPESTVYADEDNKLVVEAYDAAGNAVTKYDDLKAANLEVTSSVEANADDKLVLKKNADGTGTLYFNPTLAGTDPKNFKESGIATLIAKVNSPASSDYMVKTINVTYYEKRLPWAVSGKTDKTVNACALGETLKIDLTTLSYEDQYSNIVKTDSAVAAASTDDVSILVVQKDNVFDLSDELTIEGNNVVLESQGIKGDATVYFRYNTSERRSTYSDTKDDGEATEDKYDFKMTVSAMNVSDLSASDLKLVVNKGNAIFASSDVELKGADTTDPANNDAASATPSNADKAYVYVTGVVNGKTVVVPSAKYHLVTKKIDGLGAYDAKNNDKTETKTITVVVDSESGAQELTADVTVSNKKSAITTVKAADNKGAIGNSAASKKITSADLIQAIKVLYQYGNEMKDQDDNFRYEVTLTGTSADLDTTTTGDKSQDITIVFKTAAKVTATVKYTTLDGKITFTQDVTVNVQP